MLPESEQRLSARRREAGEIRGFMVGAAAKGEDTAFLAGMTAPVRSRLTLTDKIINASSAYHVQGVVLIPEKKEI